MDSLVIQWPMGQIQILTEVSADQRLVVEEPAGQATPAPAVGRGTMIMGVYPNPSHGQSQIAMHDMTGPGGMMGKDQGAETMDPNAQMQMMQRRMDMMQQMMDLV